MKVNNFSNSDPLSNSEEEILQESSHGLFDRYTSLRQSLQNIISIASQSSQRTRSLSPQQIEQANLGQMCAICFEDMDVESGEIFIIPICKHKFHEACIRRWKKEKATCPNCRGVMPEELGPTDEHFWIGNRQFTINARPPPEFTCRRICLSTLQAPLGIVYSLLVISSCLVFEVILFIMVIIFLLGFVQWYTWVEEEDIRMYGRICQSIVFIIIYPFMFLAILLFWMAHLGTLLYKLVSFYMNVMTCKCRWTDAISLIAVPAMISGFDAILMFLDENQPEE